VFSPTLHISVELLLSPPCSLLFLFLFFKPVVQPMRLICSLKDIHIKTNYAATTN